MTSNPLKRFLHHLTNLHNTKDVSDSALLQRFIWQHDQAAFAALLSRHGPMVLGVCQRILNHADDTADAFQATFLLLARKAGSIRQGEAVASWLYRVAYRIARNARASAACRRTKERQAATMEKPEPISQEAWQELKLVLDEELSSLPEKYRAPLILCYLQGKTNEQAAHVLGWPIGSMSCRLARGRELLRGRLIRRGVTLTTSVLGASTAVHVATAAVPAGLATASLQAALSFAAGKTATKAASASVAALTSTMLRDMILTRFQVAILLFVGLTGTAIGMGWLVSRTVSPASGVADPHASGLPSVGSAAKENLADWIDKQIRELQPTQAERRIDEIGWASDIRDALRLAREHHRPIFLFSHRGQIATGRCGGSAFAMRAHSLADSAVIALLNDSFVPVCANIEHYTSTGTVAAEEKALWIRIYHAAVKSAMYAGEDCIYVLTPEGQLLDSLPIPVALNPDRLVPWLEQALCPPETRPSDPIIAPRPLSVPPKTEAGALVLHLVARVDHRWTWSEFPAENWIVLSRDDARKLLPAGIVALGSSWELDPEVTAHFLTHFYLQSENNDVATHHFDEQALHARVVSVRGSTVQARLAGRLRMKHNFHPNWEDDRHVDATLVGILEFDTHARTIRSLRLIAERATYDRDSFRVALRSLP